VHEILRSKPLVIFSKKSCGYSDRALRTLALYRDVPDDAREVVDLEAGPVCSKRRCFVAAEVQAALGRRTGFTTVPNVFICGKSIGGGDDTERMHARSLLGPALVSCVSGQRSAAARD
jgi:glutaredoxin